MKIISVRFRCGHFEKLTLAEIKKQQVEICQHFKINGQNRAESGQYCFDCMSRAFRKVSFAAIANDLK